MRKFIVFIIAAGVFGIVVFWSLTMPGTVPASALPPHTPDLANGRTMFLAGGCASCHATPKQDDKSRLGGGLALKSPFGTFYAPNISPDVQDGIGGWSDAEFVTAMMKGTSRRGQHLFPAFPYASYQRMKYDDVRDLFAYLKSLPQVPGRVRDHDVPFPFNIRPLVGGWKLLFLDGKPFQPDSKQSAQWNRGAYLVNGPGHCAECHSTRNFLGGIIESKRFAGGPDPEGGDGWMPNITQQRLGKWSEKDIAYLLQSGSTLDGDSVGGSMGDVIKNTSQLSAEDRMAMAVYLKSLPPIDNPPPAKKTPASPEK